MKILQYIIFILILSVSYLPAQVDTNSVDIKAMLDRQISEIKEKKENTLIEKKETKIVKPAVVKTEVAKIIKEEKILNFLDKPLATKIFVGIEILLLSVLFILWFVRNKSKKMQQISILKNNIKNLREERIGSRNEQSLSNLRLKLALSPIKIDDHGKDITARAKKYNISKGEIHLAAKIKILSSQVR